MSDSAEMHFQVQGSAALPYRLKAYGIAGTFQMFCDCPAGRKARMMCKHVAALLMGEVTALVEPSDDVGELAQRAQGSEMLAVALGHAEKRPIATAPLDAGAAAGLAIALATIISTCRGMGWTVAACETSVELFRPLKGGKTLKYPDVEIVYVDDHSRPFTVRGRKDGGKAFAHLERAAALFGELAARHRPAMPGACF